MGADLILAWLVIDENREPNWREAARFISRLELDDFKRVESFDQGITGEETHEELDDMRGRALGLLDELVSVYEGDRRDVDWAQIRGAKVIVCGGTTWGDSPSDAFNAICDLGPLGVLGAAGFDDGPG